MKRNKHLGETMKLNNELQFPVLVQCTPPARALVVVLALAAVLKLIQVQAPPQVQASGLS